MLLLAENPRTAKKQQSNMDRLTPIGQGVFLLVMRHDNKDRYMVAIADNPKEMAAEFHLLHE